MACIAVAIIVVTGWRTGGPAGERAAGQGTSPGADAPAITDPPLRIPVPGHEVYGYVPYWEMDDGIAAHVAATELTTLALFSVTHGNGGHVATNQNGYKRIVGGVGERLIDEAHQRGVRVELVYTSFGQKKNDTFFSRVDLQDTAIAELVALGQDLGFDGINVDVELIPAEHVPAYAAFVARLRDAWLAVDPDGSVSVATTANINGAAMAASAAIAGADRIFLMGYDYHWAGSGPGASAPLDRRDGSEKDLTWSLDLYRDLGVPAERTILGLPLYGMSWQASGPEPGVTATSRGDAWIPRHNLAHLADPTATSTFDPIEGVQVLAIPDGDEWQAIYYDTPETLATKLALADDRGLAGGGFWAIGYERGLPEYSRLIATFAAGDLRTWTPAGPP
ncbi:MAG TPA: glycosyl hydrolase family 18 protein [Candidatus Limnocylindrales bacterium]